MRRSPVAALIVLAVGGASLTTCVTDRDASTTRYGYTGTVVAVCSHKTAGLPDCFAIKPDPGTAYHDGYYAGGGAVSFGLPPVGGRTPEIGERLTVEISCKLNEECSVVQVTAAATA